MFVYWTFVKFEPPIFGCFVCQRQSNAFYHKEKVKTKQILCNDGDGILIFSYLLITKEICIAYYFACDVRVMNVLATKRKVFGTGEKVFCYKCFCLKSVWQKIHNLKIHRCNNFYKFDITSILPTCVFDLCILYFEEKFREAFKVFIFDKFCDTVIWYVLYITFTRMARLQQRDNLKYFSERFMLFFNFWNWNRLF